jgi:hypothetical protein
MIKAILLVFEPVMTWENIARAKRPAKWVFLFYLAPLVLLSLAGELWGLHHFGKSGSYLGEPREIVRRMPVSNQLLITYGITQLVSTFVLVALGARVMQGIAQTFHTRHTYSQCFVVTAYAYGPLFLLRLLDAFPNMEPWASYGIGIVLTIATLYHGVPSVLDPDPPTAFGLYVCSMLMLACLAALFRFLTLLVLAGKIHF